MTQVGLLSKSMSDLTIDRRVSPIESEDDVLTLDYGSDLDDFSVSIVDKIEDVIATEPITVDDIVTLPLDTEDVEYNDAYSPTLSITTTTSATMKNDVNASAVNNDNDSDDDDDDDDEDDGIVVIINNFDRKEDAKRIQDHRREEEKRISDLCDGAISHLDHELQQEVNGLIRQSIKLNTTRVITIYLNGILILVPRHVPLSARLASLIWPSPIMRDVSYLFHNMDIFNESLARTTRIETMGFFTAQYKKHIIPVHVLMNDRAAIHHQQPHRYQQQQQSQQQRYLDCFRHTDDQHRHSNQNYQYHREYAPRDENKNGFDDGSSTTSGVYVYVDFTLVIIKDGKVIDCAIHGYHGNVNELVAKYKPRRIYYNATSNDALDVFMNYPYQPFYNAMHECMVPINMNINQSRLNPISFCTRRNVFCSFCKALKFVHAFFERPIVSSNTFRATPILQHVSDSASRHRRQRHPSSFAASVTTTTTLSCRKRRRMATTATSLLSSHAFKRSRQQRRTRDEKRRVVFNVIQKSNYIKLRPGKRPMSMKRTAGCDNDYEHDRLRDRS